MTKPQVSEMSEDSTQPKLVGPGGRVQVPSVPTWYQDMSEGMDDALPMEYVNEGWV
jgi:hypothetical protein